MHNRIFKNKYVEGKQRRCNINPIGFTEVQVNLNYHIEFQNRDLQLILEVEADEWNSELEMDNKVVNLDLGLCLLKFHIFLKNSEDIFAMICGFDTSCSSIRQKELLYQEYNTNPCHL